MHFSFLTAILAAGAAHPPRDDAWRFFLPGALFLYYFGVWIMIGREPKPQAAAVRYEPPQGISPAGVRYVRTTGTDGRSLAAAIAQLAARKKLVIEPEGSKFKLSKTLGAADTSDLAPEEARLLEMLFDGTATNLFDPHKGNDLNRYSLAIQGKLQTQFTGVFFTRHAGWIALGMFWSLLALLVMAATSHPRDALGAVFMTVWLFGFSLGLGGLFLTNVVPGIRRAVRGLGGGGTMWLGIAVLAIFAAVIGKVLSLLAANTSNNYAITLCAMVLLNLAWAPALKRITPRGRQTLAEIEGFRMYLEKVEQDRMQRMNAEDEAPETDVALLPYAIALDVREAWGDHLATACMAATTSR